MVVERPGGTRPGPKSGPESGSQPGRGRRIVLVRHGRTAWNLEGRAQGHADVGLDDVGRRQAKAMAQAVAVFEPSVLVSSDLSRARETAAFLEKQTGLTASEDPRWREYDVGERTGLTLQEFIDRVGAAPDGWGDVHAHVQVPGAESPGELALRMGPAFEELLDGLTEDQTAVVVSHGASLRVALACALGWPLETSNGLEAMGNCGWAVLAETGTARLRLSSYNQTVAQPTPD